jgi:CheY-like chemotaxis protein
LEAFAATLPFCCNFPPPVLKSDCNILLVEDSADDAFLLQRAFNQLPRPQLLQVARDGDEALCYLAGEGEFADRTRFPVPQAIVLDLTLPGMDALDFVQWVRTRYDQPNIPIVILSGYLGEEKLELARQLGCTKFLTKPSGEAKLLQKFAQQIQDCCLR